MYKELIPGRHLLFMGTKKVCKTSFQLVTGAGARIIKALAKSNGTESEHIPAARQRSIENGQLLT